MTPSSPNMLRTLFTSGLPWFRGKLEEWNASEKAKEGKVEMEVLDNWGLLALQGGVMSRAL
jgi:hypothetical protein